MTKITITVDDASLSARRAWIEMVDYITDYAADAVALRKESVDRNKQRKTGSLFFLGSLSARRAWIEIIFMLPLVLILRSLSARRAWIEIASRRRLSGRALVALRKESVDRNLLQTRPPRS